MNYENIRKYCSDAGIDVYVHGSYLSVGVWGVTRANKHEGKSATNIKHIHDMLLSSKAVGARGLVIHLPKKSAASIVETMEVLSELDMPGMPTLLLEMPASRPDDKTYETPEKLNNLTALLAANANVTIDWGLCIDSAHQYSCAVNFATDWDAWVSCLSDTTMNKIKLIHLNGADKKNYGNGKDVHVIATSRHDAIWNGIVSKEMRDFLARGTEIVPENDLFERLSHEELLDIRASSLFAIVQFVKSRGISLVCERGTGTAAEAKLSIDLMNGLLGSI